MSSANARLIEKDIMAAVTATEPGDSEIIDLNGASKFSCQAVYDVQAPGAKTFASPHLAALVNQSLTYTSLIPGLDQNDITIALINTGVPSQALEVSVVDSAISVNLALGAGVKATLVVQDLTYTAVDVGTAGNSITIQYVGDGVSGAETVDVTVSAIVVHMDPTAITGSSADDILAAIEASIPASALVTVVVSGTGVTVQAVAAATPLATGAAPAITSSGNAVKTAVNADSPGAADLVIVTGTNAGTVVVLSPTPLAGGTDGAIDVGTSTITIDASAMDNGLEIRLTTTGTLPAPLLTGTDYFIIKLSATEIQFAATLDDALAGTEIEIEDAGSDNAVNTVTPKTLSGASVTFQKSNSSAGPWINIQAATTIAADGTVMIEQPSVAYRYFKAVKALSEGQVDLACNILVIGPAV